MLDLQVQQLVRFVCSQHSFLMKKKNENSESVWQLVLSSDSTKSSQLVSFNLKNLVEVLTQLVGENNASLTLEQFVYVVPFILTVLSKKTKKFVEGANLANILNTLTEKTETEKSSSRKAVQLNKKVKFSFKKVGNVTIPLFQTQEEVDKKAVREDFAEFFNQTDLSVEIPQFGDEVSVSLQNEPLFPEPSDADVDVSGPLLPTKSVWKRTKQSLKEDPKNLIAEKAFRKMLRNTKSTLRRPDECVEVGTLFAESVVGFSDLVQKVFRPVSTSPQPELPELELRSFENEEDSFFLPVDQSRDILREPENEPVFEVGEQKEFFSKLVEGKGKKEVARHFNKLVCSAGKQVHVQQEKVFGEITVTKL